MKNAEEKIKSARKKLALKQIIRLMDNHNISQQDIANEGCRLSKLFNIKHK